MCLLDLGDINDITDLDEHVNLVILSESGSNQLLGHCKANTHSCAELATV